MGPKVFYFAIFVISSVSAQTQTYRVCIPSTESILCSSLDRDGSEVVCHLVESEVDCAIGLEDRRVDIGFFSSEETILLAHQQPTQHRVVASIRDVQRLEPFAFEAVAIVHANHSGGLEGLREGRYCHPGLHEPELLWSPRVLRTLERIAARTDRCPEVPTEHKTAEELEVETLNRFFSAACRPGPWSSNDTVDADLKSRFPNLCSLCGVGSDCSRYNLNMGVGVVGANNDNRHIHALECLATNGSVAFAAWQHVREYFTARRPQEVNSFAVLCEDGSLQPLSLEIVGNPTAPCSLVKQPWKTIIASTDQAPAVLASLSTWWPNGVNPGGNGWQATLFNRMVGGVNARVYFEEALPTPLNYTSSVRNIISIEATSSCLPPRRWCTVSTREQQKCDWLRRAAYILGIEPTISCQQKQNTFECLNDVKDNRADFIATPANFGFLARQHYSLSPVKLVQNSRNDPAAFARIAALVKESVAQTEVTRFENLRDKKACFPEFGGIAYMAFVNAAHERSVISDTECDYARAVGEFFDSACAGGALDATHVISDSTYNATNLCTVCRQAQPDDYNFTCAWDATNRFFGNRGALDCLADNDTHVAFLDLENITENLASLKMNASHYRVLCRNNTLAADTGVNVDESCLLAYVVDSEVLTRRNDPTVNSINTLLDSLDEFFGYNSVSPTQLIRLRIYSPFNSTNDLLFKNTAVGLSEPSREAANVPSRNYIDLFQHLMSCTSTAPPPPSLGHRTFYSVLTIFVMAFMTRFVMA